MNSAAISLIVILMVILFLHGWKSIVGGLKPSYLVEQGHRVINPKLDDDDFASAIRAAQSAYELHCPDVIVGSSRGGAVAMNFDSGSTPLVLLCPAWKYWGTASTTKQSTIILHSQADEIIPFSDSWELVRLSGLSPQALIETGHEHRLADEASLVSMVWACEVLTGGEPLPWQLESSNPGAAFDNLLSSEQEASYICDACGEEIVVPLDISQGTSQSYIEDCPVCCRANLISIEIDEDGQITVSAYPE